MKHDELGNPIKDRLKIKVGDQSYQPPEKLSHIQDSRYDSSMLQPSRLVGTVYPAPTFSDEERARMLELASTVDCGNYEGVYGVDLVPSATIITGTGITIAGDACNSIIERITVQPDYDNSNHAVQVSLGYQARFFNRGVEALRRDLIRSLASLDLEDRKKFKALIDAHHPTFGA
jgi:hypothetical protein